jgi:hypothetical protein
MLDLSFFPTFAMLMNRPEEEQILRQGIKGSINSQCNASQGDALKAALPQQALPDRTSASTLINSQPVVL